MVHLNFFSTRYMILFWILKYFYPLKNKRYSLFDTRVFIFLDHRRQTSRHTRHVSGDSECSEQRKLRRNHQLLQRTPQRTEQQSVHSKKNTRPRRQQSRKNNE